MFAEDVFVFEGDSVSLNSDHTEMKDDDVIQWRFKNTLIAEINKRADSITVYDDVLDGRFRDRLKLDKQTGSLTITNTTTEHEGVYDLQINSEIKRFILAVIGEFKKVYTCFLMTFFLINSYNIFFVILYFIFLM